MDGLIGFNGRLMTSHPRFLPPTISTPEPSLLPLPHCYRRKELNSTLRLLEYIVQRFQPYFGVTWLGVGNRQSRYRTIDTGMHVSASVLTSVVTSIGTIQHPRRLPTLMLLYIHKTKGNFFRKVDGAVEFVMLFLPSNYVLISIVQC